MGVWLVVAGLAVHIVFFYSIFDIYFTSPLVHGMTPHSVPLKPPAKRLLLFVADGLRADKFFELEEDGSSRAPFLRTIIEQRGAWGVSHTRVPTESRPGHVALIAGFYEDVSAVAKGWKENPVEFDSLFNESRYTWSWGSPDILPMFSKGASGDHVFIDMYPSESEDFAGSDTSKLDTWVFDRVKDFLSEGRKNVTLGNMLHQDKLVFFLHLLGIDTNGHSHKPYSKEYLDNIRIVDSGIRELTSLIEEFYEHDGRTAYIMSADHGMTDWGSHGASHPSETLTPLVAWGAGVRGPNMGEEIQEKQAFCDTFSQDWDLSHISRKDVEQADITSLMAALIGTSFPVNSVGVLPLDYINASDEFKAHAIFTNTQQILAQLTIKMAEKQETTLSWLFRPYKALPVDNQIQFVKSIQRKIHGKEYREAIEDSRELIQLALDGLEYYHGYDRLFLGASIAMGYLGWITYILTIIIQDYTNIVATSKIAQSQATYLRSEEGIRTIFAILGAIVAFLLYVQSLPWTHYIYCLLPIMLWNEALLKINVISQVKESIEGVGNLMMIIFKVFVAVAGLEILVLTFFYRELLTLGLVAMAIWPIMTSLRSSNKMVVVFWSVSCLSVAVFPMLPVVGRDTDYRLVSLAGWTILALGLYAFRQLSKNAFYSPIRSNKLHVLFFSQLVTLGVAILILNSTSSSIASKQGLPLLNQGLSWLILVLSVLQPLLGSTHMVPRLLSLGVSLSAPYILLSMSHEALFYLSLCCLLYAWLLVEYSNTSHTIKANELDFSKGSVLGEPTRNLHTADLRVAYFFVFFILTAFFGTGNIASINSFDPVSVYCFLTIFNPFIMGALMLWKIVILFILVTCTFSAIHVILNVPTKSLFMVVLLMSDFMALHFFFLVRDSGSWLEIGTSISHYVIVMTMIIFLMLLLGIAKLFTTFQFTCTSRRKSHFQ